MDIDGDLRWRTRAWVRRLVIMALVVGLLIAVAALLGGWLFDRVLFSEAKSGDGWKLAGRSPAEVDEPTLAASLDQGELALSFSVYSGTGGNRECRQPTVILDGLDRRTNESWLGRCTASVAAKVIGSCSRLL